MIGKVGLHGNQDKPHAVIFKRAADKGRLSRLTPAKIAIALDSVPGMLYDFRKPAPPGSRPLPTRRTPHPWGHPARDSERFAEIGCSSASHVPPATESGFLNPLFLFRVAGTLG